MLRILPQLLVLSWVALSGCGSPGIGAAADAAAEDAVLDHNPGDVSADLAGPDTARLCQEPPQIQGFVLQPNPNNVLSGLMSFSTDRPTIWELDLVQVQSGQGTRILPELLPAVEHRIPVLGLRASSAYRLTLKVLDPACGLSRTQSVDYVTPALPVDLPPMKFMGSQPERMMPGLTLFNVLSWADIQGKGLLLAVDPQGNVVWYHNASAPLVESLFTSQGTLLAVIGEFDGVIELDALGNLLHWWKPKDLGLDSLHHAVGLSPEGNLLGLATQLRTQDGYPAQNGGTVSYQVVGEIAVEFTRAGQLVHSWPLLDVLDPYHYNAGFFMPFWTPLYPDAVGGPKDWGHGNGILVPSQTDHYVVTLANQDLVVCLNRTTGQVIWSAGESGTVQLQGAGQWFSNPHGVEFSDQGRLLVYDDGTYKGTVPPRSRVTEYQILAPAQEGQPWTAFVTWSWDGNSLPFFSYSPADVDYLGNGNVLVLHGSLVGQPDNPPMAPQNTLSVRIQELAKPTAPEPVFTLEIGGPWDPSRQKFSAFAASRIASLYPQAWGDQELSPDCQSLCLDVQCGSLGGCQCGTCAFGEVCVDAQCKTCPQACLGRMCGAVELQCDCGSCPAGKLCDAEGACQDATEFCLPYCQGRECGVVGAIYLGQTCACGTCPADQECEDSSGLCLAVP